MVVLVVDGGASDGGGDNYGHGMTMLVMVVVIVRMVQIVVKHSMLTYSFNKYLLRTFENLPV